MAQKGFPLPRPLPIHRFFMSLFTATLLSGIILLAAGGALFSRHSIILSLLKGFPRSLGATYLLFGSATAWFLFRVWHLPEADFGDYRGLLFILFSLVAVLSFHYVPDFLAVRGLAALMLLAAGPLLGAAFMQYQHPQRLLLVSAVYAFILLSLWLGMQPYRMRDFIEWLLRGERRARILGGAAAGYGLLLIAVAFTY